MTSTLCCLDKGDLYFVDSYGEATTAKTNETEGRKKWYYSAGGLQQCYSLLQRLNHVIV